MLSEVPEGWKQATLGEVLEVMRNGFSCKQEKSPLEGYAPVSRIETISTGSIDASRVGYVPYEEKLERYKIEKGDILFSHINSVEHIAKVAFAEEAQRFYHAMNLLLLRSDSTKIVPRYLADVLRWEPTRAYFREHCKRAVNQASLNQKNISGYELALPPLNEQHRIAEVLSSVDASIQATQAVIEQAERVKRGLMEQLLTEGLGSAAIERGEVPEGWQKTQIGRYISIETGKLDANAAVKGGLYKFFTCAVEDYAIDNYAFDGDYIILAGNGDLNVKHYTGKFNAYQRTYVITSIDPDFLDNRFYYYWQLYYLERLRNNSVGGVIKYLKLGMIKDAEVALPPLNKQRRIADILVSVDDFIAKNRATIEQRKRVKKGLMDDLLTGKVRTV